MAEVVNAMPQCLVEYHQHDTLFVNQDHEKLTAEEVKEAWDEYDDEKKVCFKTKETNFRAVSTIR